MKRVEPQITTIRGRLNSFFAAASFSWGVSSRGYDTGSFWWCGPRGACGDENEGVQDSFVTNDRDTLATALYATTDDMLKEHPTTSVWSDAFALTGAKADERETLLDLLAAECELLRERPR